MQRWETAVVIANAFLESPYRRTLPAGNLTLEETGMTFYATGGAWPVRVRYDAIGQVCVALGFAAQERVDGFAVGKAPPRAHAVTDNTFFLHRNGSKQSPESMAALILHELTHEVLRDGTVSLPKAFAYYAEAALTFRTRTLTAERRPYATSEELWRFLESRGKDAATQTTMLADFEMHLSQGPTKFCRHGPFPIPTAPLPSTPIATITAP